MVCPRESFRQARPRPGPPLPSAMARKGSPVQEAVVKARPKRRPWMVSQGVRLETQRRELGDFPPTAEAFAGSSFLAPDALRPATAASLMDSQAQAARGADAAARLLHRRSQEGLLKTGFEPQRHTCIVAGRPIQVLGTLASIV